MPYFFTRTRNQVRTAWRKKYDQWVKEQVWRLFWAIVLTSYETPQKFSGALQNGHTGHWVFCMLITFFN